MPILSNPQFGPFPSGTVIGFYETGTLTLATIYEDDTLSVGSELVNPIVIGAPPTGQLPAIGGYAPPVFYDPTVKLRMRITLPGQTDPFYDADPMNEFVLITADELAPGAALGNLGFTPANAAGQVFSGNTGASIATLTEINDTDFGYALRAPNIKDTAYQISLSDCGQTLLKDDASSGDVWTIPPHATTPLPPGFWFRVRVINTNSVSVTRGAGVTLQLAGSATSQNVTCAEWCDLIFTCDAQDVWCCVGTGGT